MLQEEQLGLDQSQYSGGGKAEVALFIPLSVLYNLNEDPDRFIIYGRIKNMREQIPGKTS